MRILLDNAAANHLNLGDLCMLMVAAARVRRAWPTAKLQVITHSPQRLKEVAPDALPVPHLGSMLAAERWNLLGGLHRLLPAASRDSLCDLERTAFARWPRSAERWSSLRRARRQTDRDASLKAYIEAMVSSDVVIGTGGGYINDQFPSLAEAVLLGLRIAQRNGAKTAMIGQGLGPLSNRSVQRSARRVLPHLQLLMLREGTAGPSIAHALGVSTDRIIVTGDDAIEYVLEHAIRQDRLMIGVNIRIAKYSGVSAEHARDFAASLQAVARSLAAPCQPIPIALDGTPNDLESATGLLPIDPSALAAATAARLPQDMVRLVGRCRVMVTGSYHGAVFALSQGIPVVAISANDYYDGKFEGLANMFGDGMRIVPLTDHRLEQLLQSAVGELWDAAADLEPKLVDSARRQAKRGSEAFALLHTDAAPAHSDSLRPDPASAPSSRTLRVAK